MHHFQYCPSSEEEEEEEEKEIEREREKGERLGEGESCKNKHFLFFNVFVIVRSRVK